MKKTIAVLVIATTLALTGCASGNSDATTGEPTRLQEQNIKLNDGRELTCVTYKLANAGGLSCDWGGAR